jgi:hypothetical protein
MSQKTDDNTDNTEQAEAEAGKGRQRNGRQRGGGSPFCPDDANDAPSWLGKQKQQEERIIGRQGPKTAGRLREALLAPNRPDLGPTGAHMRVDLAIWGISLHAGPPDMARDRVLASLRGLEALPNWAYVRPRRSARLSLRHPLQGSAADKPRP